MKTRIQSPIEERLNWITHGLGFVFSIIAFFKLLDLDSHKTRYSTIAIILYAVGMSILYFASTTYHYTSNISLKRKLRVLDHVSIYLLIAGTYAPVTLITLINSKGLLIFVLVWVLAIVGSILKLFFTGRFQVLSIALYVFMGWMIIIDIGTLSKEIGDEGINFLAYGGIAYTVGIVFYALKNIPFTHVIWHLFVLVGSVFHFLLILEYVI